MSNKKHIVEGTDIQMKRSKALKKAALPLIKYLAENHHPHVIAHVTSTSIELAEGLLNITNITDFIKD